MREEVIKKILIAVTALVLLLYALGPFTWMLIISFVENPDFLVTGTARFTFQNYVNVVTLEQLHFIDYLKNSLIVSGVAAVGITIITSFAGYAISRLSFPGRVIIPLAVLAMSMFPQISIVGYLYRFFTSLGLLNTYTALIFPYIAWVAPIALWINISYFQQIPNDLDRAALVDGAKRTKTLFRIILPLALPGIFSSFLIAFIQCFNEFLFALMLTIDYDAQTLPVGVALFQGIHGEIPWGNLMAASALAAVPLVIIALVFQRFIVQGLMGGALKG
jgi:multiple sugar transport system permease protein